MTQGDTMNRAAKTFVLSIVTVTSVFILFACATTKSLPARHPMEVQGMPLCSECHTDGRTSLDHRQDWNSRHKFQAAQQQRTCELCHAQSFCADCHANKEELKPSDKYKDAPQRIMPHRGDYLNQHKIDGKLNPASCFPCHGRQNNERCKTCHK
jgi:hypothetical protein